MKLIKKQEIIGSRTKISFYVNGIHIATAERYSDWFCSIKNGVRSNLRNQIKKCSKFTWSKIGLVQLLGHDSFTIGSSYIGNYSFMESFPDTTWGGGTGRIPNNKEILTAIEHQIKGSGLLVKSK